MKNKVCILVSNTADPYFNLATEEWIFNNSSSDEHILFLWRNAPTVVIGRSQNPWVECRLEKMNEAHVNLVRRQSGGGAVYHDLGNSIFTFISPLVAYDKTVNNDIVLAALKTFRITAEASGRNDLVVSHEGVLKKFSGSGFKQTKDRALHHGTVLLHTDLERLQDYLSPQPGKLVAKGVTSVASRVINLRQLNAEINHERLCVALMSAFCEYYDVSVEAEVLDHAALASIPSLAQSYEHLKSWDWIYGKTMEFSHQLDTRFAWGSLDVNLLVEDGLIREAVIYSDSLVPDFITAFSEVLKGVRYEANALDQVVHSLGVQFPELSVYAEECGAWLRERVMG